MVVPYNQKCRNNIVNVALGMKEGKVDILDGLRKIYAIWTDADLEENETYLYLKAIESETDQVIKGDIQNNFTKEFLEEQKKFEEEYLKVEKPFIDKLIEELSQIPIVEEQENPYAWPFEN